MLQVTHPLIEESWNVIGDIIIYMDWPQQPGLINISSMGHFDYWSDLPLLESYI